LQYSNGVPHQSKSNLETANVSQEEEDETNSMALNINEQARKEANLRLLQRSVDRSISNILGSATHVVLYEFSQDSQSWEKSDVEGSMFLAVRPSGYLLAILNRNSRDNYPIELSADFQLQHSDPYLIFRQQQNGKTIIRGIWFPNAAERVSMNDMLQIVLEDLRNPKPTPQPAAAAAPAAVVVDQSAALSALLSPVSLNSHAAASSSETPIRRESPSQNANPQPTLDKKSLQLALLSLIQDDRFLDLIHAQYLKVAHARANRNNNSS
jgi:mRNA-decapping enzyme 1B